MESSKSGKNKECLWTLNFVMINIINVCVCMSFYMHIPLMSHIFAPQSSECYSILSFALGLTLFAPFANYLLDTYRRKSVAEINLLIVALVSVIQYFFILDAWIICVLRMLQGAAYGFFQIALGSTLLLDLTDSKMRTKAAHTYYWLMRMSLVLGPALCIIMRKYYTVVQMSWVTLALIALSVLFVFLLSVPFRTPLEPKLISLDRFWLPRGWVLFLPLFLSTLQVGISLSGNSDIFVYTVFSFGLLASLLLHMAFFRDKLSYEMIVGMVLMCISAVLTFFNYVPPMLLAQMFFMGMGIGMITSRFLLSYIRVCEHCERGTAQTSYFYGWEGGLLVGIFIANMFQIESEKLYSYLYVSVSVLVLLFYLFYVKKWYFVNKRK